MKNLKKGFVFLEVVFWFISDEIIFFEFFPAFGVTILWEHFPQGWFLFESSASQLLVYHPALQICSCNKYLISWWHLQVQLYTNQVS